MAGTYIETRGTSPQQGGLWWICGDSVTGVFVSKANKCTARIIGMKNVNKD